MKKLLFFAGLLCMVSCSKTNEEIITSHKWKHGSGYPVAGDWIDLSNGTVFSNDTIYKNNNPVAVVDSISTYYNEYRLYLKSLSDNKSGTYAEKGEN